MKTVLTPEEESVYRELIKVASKCGGIDCSDLCQRAGLKLDMSVPADRGKIGSILGNISFYEYEAGRPLLSSVVVSKNNKRGDGFFKLAEELGYGDWQKLKREGKFAYDMMNATHDFWSKNKLK